MQIVTKQLAHNLFYTYYNCAVSPVIYKHTNIQTKGLHAHSKRVSLTIRNPTVQQLAKFNALTSPYAYLNIQHKLALAS